MTQDEIKALIEDLRLNHEFCPKEVILQAADELERMQVRIPRPPKKQWVGFTHEELAWLNEALNLGGRFAVIEAIEAKLKEKNSG
jgi:hypothetical protein